MMARFLDHALRPLSAALLLACGCAHAQMPTAKEMEEAMRAMQQMQRELDKLTPEQRQMLEQARQQMPTAAAPGSEDDEIGVPKRDAARIAQVPRQPLTGAQLKAHVQALQPKLRRALAREALRRAEMVEDVQRKAGGDFTARLRAAANGLAAMGAWPEATFLMGKVALASGNAQDLNNLAAFLTMQKAGHAALPILITLDARYPNNSTILNNLGQAWFELGDVKEAERVLLLAVRRSPNHPQANVTKSRIEEARGDKAAAQASMRAAIRGGYSEAKEARLRKLGGRFDPRDVLGHLNLPPPAHPLGLSDPAPPAYPRSAQETVAARLAWQAYFRGLEETTARLEASAVRAAGQRESLALSGVRPGMRMSVTKEALRMLSFHAPFASLAKHVMRANQAASKAEAQRVADALAQAERQEEAERAQLEQRVKAIKEAGEQRYRNVPGGYQLDYSCQEVLALQTAYLEKVVPALESAAQAYVRFHHRHFGDMANLLQYMVSDDEFDRQKDYFRAQFLYAVGRAHNRIHKDGIYHSGFFGNGIDNYAQVCLLNKKKEPATRKHKLVDFDEMNCGHTISFAVPGIGRYDIRCNTASIELDPFASPAKVKWSEDLIKDRVLTASVEIGKEIAEGVKVTVGAQGEFDEQGLRRGSVGANVEVDVAKAVGEVVTPDGRAVQVGSAGPGSLGLDARAGVGVEFDRSGVTDVRIHAGVGAKASSTVAQTDAASPGVQAGTQVSGTWSWNAGTSASVSGNFDRNAL
jgi:hypothetical protein